jgi:uncharacterized protein YcsI (UPF0317 family)
MIPGLFAAFPDVFAIFSALNFLDFAAMTPGYAMLLGGTAALPKQPRQLLQMVPWQRDFMGFLMGISWGFMECLWYSIWGFVGLAFHGV